MSPLHGEREESRISSPFPDDCVVQFDRPIKNVRALGVAIKEAVNRDISLFRVVQIALMALCPVCAIWIGIWIRQDSRKQLAFYLAIAESKKALEKEIDRRQQIEQTLKAKERLLLATLESTADAILVVNSEGRTVLVNHNFVKLWGITDDLLAERDDEKMLTFVLDQLEEPQKFLAKVRLLYQTADEDSDTLYFRDGRVIFRFSQPLMEEDTIKGRVWSFRDITEIEKAERALKQLQAQNEHAL
jgi:PAS domain S-box-containing protein